MGLLDSVLGAVVGQTQAGGNSQLIQLVRRMLANDAPGGGLAGLVEQFQRSGMADVVNSWISTGNNLPISADQLSNVLGPEALGQLAQQLGLSQGQAAAQLSDVLPQVVDQLTPGGQLPQEGLGELSDLLGRFVQR